MDALDEDEEGAVKALESYLDAKPYVHFDPLDTVESLRSHLGIGMNDVYEDENAIGLIVTFFDLLTDALRLPGGPKMTVEIVLGEITDFMDRLRYNCLEFRPEATEDGFDTSKFPRAYERIHLNNVT